jgi:tRNA(Ile)-lysidine synthase
VLLHQLQDYRYSYEIILWHINHGLQDIALDMEHFARTQAEHYGVEYLVDRLRIDPTAGNVEATARQLRYQLFEEKLTNSDALLTAHHMNDQAETLLLNLMRGSGFAGLSAIANQRPLGRGILFRPLLNQTREQIHDYAKDHGLKWFDDPSNAWVHYDRNFTRHHVMPVLLERWPAAVQQLHRAAEWQSEIRLLMTELAEQDHADLSRQMPFTPYPCLSVERLKQLSYARCKNLVRHWLQSQGKRPLGYKKIQSLFQQLDVKADAMPLIPAEGCDIRLYQQYLYIVDQEDPVELAAQYRVPEQGRLQIEAIGFNQDRSSLLDYLGQSDSGQQLMLRFRSAQEDGPNHYRHKLKRLFQQHRIPPWVRSSVPMIMVDEELQALWLEPVLF